MKRLRKWNVTEEIGGLRHISEVYESRLERSTSGEYSKKKDFHPIKEVSESLKVRETWEIAAGLDEESGNQKKKMSLDEEELFKDTNSTSSGET